MRTTSQHAEWLSLIEVSGPFLVESVLEKAFPQGLDAVQTPKRQRLRAAYEEWRDAVDENDPLLPELHREWIRRVLVDILEFDASTLVKDADYNASFAVFSPDRTESFSPDFIVRSPTDGKPRLFVSRQPPGTDLQGVPKGDNWLASVLERMTTLCRVNGVPLGLVIDGERWMLVNAPVGVTSSDASWYANLWFQEPVTLKAFQSLLGIRRFFGPLEETLEALLQESLEHHEEITDTLEEQVRRAVEVLIQCLDREDANRNRELLRDVSPEQLYEAGLTVMMRLVFVLCAEERGLLLSGDPVYDESYAISTLRAQLAEESDRHGPEILDRRHDAWARLLSVFRAIHGGIDHESLRMPAMGGSLFDPDRFPFLEGRAKGTSWRESDAMPLPIDNRTVLLLLTSLQLLQQKGGALLLSYRSLDVEQIGHVYEGLLEHTVARVPSVTVGLLGSAIAKNANLPLSELEAARTDGEKTVLALLTETTKRSESAIRKALALPVDGGTFGQLLSVCGGDASLAQRIAPFANLLRKDAWEEPIVYRKNAFIVTVGPGRRETGTHYTPRSLTESIVEKTLEPVTYFGPAEGKPRDEWRLKSSSELLDLKVCDPAMGSGAFLVQVCRWLSERLVEAWETEKAAGKFLTADGEVREEAGEAEPMSRDLDERVLLARRLIAERCLYGVDVNPFAVELAKLSIWLVTLAKGRPFGFLDHNLRHGDSLLGIHRLDQIIRLRMNPDGGPHQMRIFAQIIERSVSDAIEIRSKLRSTPVRDIHDVAVMERLEVEARAKLEAVELVADAMIGEALCSGGSIRQLDSTLDALAVVVGAFVGGNNSLGDVLKARARTALAVDLPKGKPARDPFHWPLEFPEVFARKNSGFDATIGNPPYIFGELRPRVTPFSFVLMKGQWDYCWLFVERCFSLLNDRGGLGLVLPDSILAREGPAVLRQFVVARASFLSVIHAGLVFKAGVSTFALCVSLQSYANSVYSYVGSKGEGTARPLALFKEDPKLPWLSNTITETTTSSKWVSMQDLVEIGRGEEVGKKHLIENGGRQDDFYGVPVVSGAGVRALIMQPYPTHLMPASLPRKSMDGYRAPKIIAVKTGNTIRAGIDRIGLVTLQSAYNIRVKTNKWGFTVEFICALLVSGEANRRFIEPVTTMKKLFPQITQSMVLKINVPVVDMHSIQMVTDSVREYERLGDPGLLARIDAMISRCYSAREL